MNSDHRRVFVSHSSHDPFADKVRRAVCRQLREKNYAVLVDADELRAGQDWRGVLTHWLADCHAAVLLLSADALRSAWVKREVNILLWRRSLGSTVHIVPALVGGVSPRDVTAAGLGELRNLQYAGVGWQGTSDADAEALADAVTAQLATLPPVRAGRDQMRKWIDRISYFLGQVGDVDKLGECARELGVADEELHLVKLPEGNRFLAHQLLDDGLSRRTYHAVRAINDFIGHEWLRKLVSDVAFTWVNGAAAVELLALSRETHPAVAVLNARSPATADEYLDRATCRGGYWREVAGIVTGEDAVSELVAHYERAVARLHGIEPPWTIEDIEPRDEPCFLVVDPAGNRLDAVTAALRTVRQRYPWIVILLLTGPGQPADEESAGWQLGPVRVLAPPLRPGEELVARRTVRDLRELLTR